MQIPLSNLQTSISISNSSLASYMRILSTFFNKEGFTVQDPLEAKLKNLGLKYFILNSSNNIRSNVYTSLEDFSKDFKVYPVAYKKNNYAVVYKSIPKEAVIAINPQTFEGIVFCAYWR